MELTILMPCLNEAATIGICIRKAKKWIAESNIDAEILVSDNGSTDESKLIAIAEGARVTEVSHRGYGAALIHGIEEAKGMYIIMGDSDDTYDFTSLDRFLVKLREGNELVMGNRFIGGISIGAMPFLHRYLGNPVLSGLGRLFFNAPVGDFHCGLRAFRRDSIMKLHLQTLGMEFASEMVVKACLYKLRISEVSVRLSASETRRSHLHTWSDGWRHLCFLLMHSPKWLFYIPGLFLFFLGFLLMLLTMMRPFEIVKGIYFDTNTLLYSGVFINTGFSIIALGMFATTYALQQGFLPYTTSAGKVMKVFTMEKGLLIGLFFLFAGLAGMIYSFILWKRVGFGNLEYRSILRIVIPSATVILLGTQFLFSSFFIGILKMPLKRASYT